MRETYRERRRKERLSQFPILRKRKRKVVVLSYREQQCVDADNRMRYHALRQNYLGGSQ